MASAVRAQSSDAARPELRMDLEDLLDRVHALVAGDLVSRPPEPSHFAAAEARAKAMAQDASGHTRDLADAAVQFAAEALVTLIIEHGRLAVEDCGPLIESVADVSGLSQDAAAFSLYLRAIANPLLLTLPPRVGISRGSSNRAGCR